MSKVFTGSKASLKLNGAKVAFVGSVNINHENTLTDIDVLDQLDVAEHAETGHKVSFTCNLFKVDENAASLLGLDPANLDDILSQPELTMEVFDRVGDKVQYTMSGVKWEGGSGSVDARGVWQGVWNFKGRRGRGL
jgi:hypothetical protein